MHAPREAHAHAPGLPRDAGEDADTRMAKAAQKRGVHLTSVSRPLRPEDFADFEYMVGMDPKNMDAMQVRTGVVQRAHEIRGVCECASAPRGTPFAVLGK